MEIVEIYENARRMTRLTGRVVGVGGAGAGGGVFEELGLVGWGYAFGVGHGGRIAGGMGMVYTQRQ